MRSSNIVVMLLLQTLSPPAAAERLSSSLISEKLPSSLFMQSVAGNLRQSRAAQALDAFLKRVTGEEPVKPRERLDGKSPVEEEWDLAKAFFLTSTSSVDDVLWLLPFAVHEDRIKFCSCYLAVRISLTAAAAAGGKLFQDADAALPSVHLSKVLSLMLVATTAVLAWLLFVQWRREVRARQLETQDSVNAAAEAGGGSEQCGGGMGMKSLDLYKVAMMTCLASLDNETLYVAALGDKLITTWSLLFCQIVVSSSIILACAGVGYFSHVVEWIASIPLFVFMLLTCIQALVAFFFSA